MKRYDLLLFFFVAALFVIGLCIYLSPSLNIKLVFPSLLLFILVSLVISFSKNFFSPTVFFSVLFFGYSFSGIYFSFDANIENAIYYQSSPFDIDDMVISIYTILLGYLFFVTGGYLATLSSSSKFYQSVENKKSGLFTKPGIKFLFFLFCTGFSYWLYNSFVMADGPFDLLSKIGVYHTLLEMHSISTTPYIITYGSLYLLFINHLQCQKKISTFLMLMIFLAFLMRLSTGRLTGSILFLASFPLIYVIVNNYRVRVKHLIYGVFLLLFLLLLYFYRYYSNLSYIGLSVSENPIVVLGKLLFGRTNIGDLQSITFAYKYIENSDLLYGRSFLDFSIFWLNKLTPFEFSMMSTGIRLKNKFFSAVGDSSSVPAPGIISEMIMNFGSVGVYAGMLILGYLLSKIGFIILRMRGILCMFVYTMYLLFLFILPKVDSTSVQGFIWNLVPVFVIFISMRILKLAGNNFGIDYEKKDCPTNLSSSSG